MQILRTRVAFVLALATAVIVGLTSADRNSASAAASDGREAVLSDHPIKQPRRKESLRARAKLPRPEDIAFVRPGMHLQIQKIDINAPSVVVTFRISDDADQGLDRTGVNTPGAIDIGYTLARIRPGNQQYTSYYTAPAGGITSPGNFADAGGTYESLGNGVYRYTMGVKLPADYDANATTTLGMWASRNLTDFNMGVPNANAVLDFVPAGGSVQQTRDIVRTAACNQCHDPLAVHGVGVTAFNRREVRLCVLCHYAEQINPQTGNTIDARVFFHKVHMGANLPSVTGKPLNFYGMNGSGTATTATGALQNPMPAGYDPAKLSGKPYKIVIGNGGFDASTIVFPQDVRNCTTCHQAGAAQSDAWKTNPSRAACGSCHDDVDFATGKNHVGGAQTDDAQCTTCHPADAVKDFDISVAGAHTLPTTSKQLAGLNVKLIQVTGAAAGGSPQVTFSVTNNSGAAVDTTTLGRLMLTIAGPTTEYATEPPWQEDVRNAPSGSGTGVHVYTFTGKFPKDASGTWAVGAEAFRVVTLGGPLLGQSISVRESAFNPVMYFSVDGSKVVPRRAVVALDNCRTCHSKNFAHHGGARNNVEYCVMCHNPNHGDNQKPPQTVNFRTMVHGIHMGVALDNEYSAGGSTGVNFNGVRFPGDPRNCSKCHVAGSNLVPVPDGLLPTVMVRFFFSPLQPTASACLGCHNGEDAAAHVFQMTAPFGESCAVCHGEDADFAVSKVHARKEVWGPEDAK